MEIDEWPDCCGAQIIEMFPYAHSRAGTAKTLDKYLKQLLDNPPYYAWIFAIINEYQEERLGEIFRANKFVRTKRRICPTSGQEIFLYIHKPHLEGIK